MTIETTTLRPGLLVSLSTSVRGNVRYTKRTIKENHRTKTGAEQAEWITERTIHDPEEFERAKKARNKAGALIRGVCVDSAFGLLCPEPDADRLQAAIAEAREIAQEFNKTAKLTHVTVYCISGRVAADDVEAMRAINSEVRELLDTMRAGVEDLDVKRIRDAADQAKQLGAMLTPESAARVQVAIEAVRKTAREIVKAGEDASVAIDKIALRKLKEARTAFLDLDDDTEVQAPVAQGRAVDLTAAE